MALESYTEYNNVIPCHIVKKRFHLVVHVRTLSDRYEWNIQLVCFAIKLKPNRKITCSLCGVLQEYIVYTNNLKNALCNKSNNDSYVK